MNFFGYKSARGWNIFIKFLSFYFFLAQRILALPSGFSWKDLKFWKFERAQRTYQRPTRCSKIFCFFCIAFGKCAILVSTHPPPPQLQSVHFFLAHFLLSTPTISYQIAILCRHGRLRSEIKVVDGCYRRWIFSLFSPIA